MLDCNGDIDNYDYNMSIASMLPEKNRKSIKSIILYNHKHNRACDTIEYLVGLLDNREKFPALLRVDACCENTNYYRRPVSPYGGWKHRATGLEVWFRHEDHGSSRVWKLAAPEGDSSWPEWREETQLARTGDLRKPVVWNPAAVCNRSDDLPQATAQKQDLQRRRPRIKKLLHKLLCARAE